MPKGKGKRSDRQGKAKTRASPRRTEESIGVEDDEVMSTASQNSLDTRSGDDLNNEGNDDSLEEIEVNVEQNLDDFLDGATQKSAKGRQASLLALQKVLKSRVFTELVANRMVTFQDLVEKCLKRGQAEDRVLAASIASLVCIQLGVESEGFFKVLKPILTMIIQDPTASIGARASCCSALGLCCFIAAEDGQDSQDCAKVFESVFNNNKTITQVVAPLYYNALLSWALLLTVVPESEAYDTVRKFLRRVSCILEANDISVRIAAGEALALMYEKARAVDRSFVGEKARLCEQLKDLATDSDKHKAKKDLRHQRSSFRDVMRAIEDGSVPDETIKFGVEYLELYSWTVRRQYSAFKECLGTGMPVQLQGNELLRDIFELGPVVNMEEMQLQKVSKFQRNQYNNAASKARTLVRGKNRDKRNVSAY